MEHYNPLDAKTRDYLKEAVIANSPMPIDAESLESFLSDIKIEEDSSKKQFKLPKDFDLKWSHPKNMQSIEEDGLISSIHLRRVIKNVEKGYVEVKNIFERGGKHIQEAIQAMETTGFSSSTFCRYARAKPAIKELMAKSLEAGHQYSIMGIWDRQFYSQDEGELDVKRPFLVIPGITSPEELKIIRQFEERWQKPTVEQVLKQAGQRNYNSVLKKLKEAFLK